MQPQHRLRFTAPGPLHRFIPSSLGTTPSVPLHVALQDPTQRSPLLRSLTLRLGWVPSTKLLWYCVNTRVTATTIVGWAVLSTDHRNLEGENHVCVRVLLCPLDLCLEPALILQMDKWVKEPLCVTAASLGRR